MTSLSASVSLKVLRQEGRWATSNNLGGAGRKAVSAFNIFDKQGTVVLAAPIISIHTAMMYLVYEYLVYIPECNYKQMKYL